MMIAEESTAWAKVTYPPDDGGLGFNFKWNMGWANDMFDYVSTDPFFRKYNHSKLNFSMMYAFSENFILPVSHDEVVHGKRSLIDKMFGSYDEKFKGIRLFLAHMMAHPGKKMLFMGSEYGQFREWDYQNQLEWFMLSFDTHRALQKYTSELNHFYLSNDALWYDDFTWDGFRWVLADESEKNLLAYMRLGSAGKKLLCVFNFSGAEVSDYPITLQDCPEKKWKCVFFSGDKHSDDFASVRPELSVKNGKTKFSLPALSAAYYEPGGKAEIRLKNL